MPIYHLQDQESKIDIVVEAKSETAARLHLTRHATAKVIGAKELATLVIDGVQVERANSDDPAALVAAAK